MNLKSNILTRFPRSTLWISLILVVGISFSTGGAMASNCQGGTDCLNCAAMTHPHMPGLDVEMVNQSCQTPEPGSSCGFETGRSADEFDRVATVAQSVAHTYTGIFSSASNESDLNDLYRGFIAQYQYPERSKLTPIYLLSLSLLC